MILSGRRLRQVREVEIVPGPEYSVRMFRILLLTLAYLTLRPEPAHAYLDPGSGSLVFQIIIGTLAAFFFALKTSWLKIKKLFGWKQHPEGPENKE